MKHPAARPADSAQGDIFIVFQILAVASILFSLSACGDETSDYFPLKTDVTWVYRDTITIRNKGNAGGLERSRLATAATNMPPRSLGDRKTVPLLYADGRALYMARMGDGIALVGRSRPGDDAAQEIAPRYLMKLPLAVGVSWSSDGETELLRRTYLSGAGAVDKPIAADGPIVYTIESLGDTVHVRAGTFRHCLRIHGIGSAKLDWGEPFGMLTVSFDVVRWYAPGVGLVKRTRKEDTGIDGPLGADLDEELDAVIKPGWFG